MNPLWATTENQDCWATIHSCDARVIATQDPGYVRDSARCVMNGNIVVSGAAPSPEWPFRGKFLQKKLRPFSGPGHHLLPVVDVGLDSVRDHDWVRSGGIDQNQILDESGERLNYSIMYGFPAQVFHESDTDASSDGSIGAEVRYYTELSARYGAEATKEIHASCGFWANRELPTAGNAGLDGAFGQLAHSKLFAGGALQGSAGLGLRSAADEKADSELSLNASNNMSVDR